MRLSAVLLAVAITACASAGDPPGGPPDQQAPIVLRVEPESGAVLAAPPGEANIYFDEVISERITATPADIAGAVILSPVKGEVRVRWHRDRLSVRPRDGFQAGRVYRLELLPVIADLRTNRMRAGRTAVFSTGPDIPTAAIEGSVVDWVAGRPAVRSLVEAVLMPDSLPYRALADSGGVFRLAQIPPGHYVVFGVLDANNDRRRGPRESFDTVAIDVADSTGQSLELYAFAHDTSGPRLRQVEVVDTITLKLTFDRPLEPAQVIDTAMVMVAPVDDSTSLLPLLGVYTQKQLDSLRAAAQARVDSARAAADTTARAPADTARAPADTVRLPRPAARPGAPQAVQAPRPPLDSTRADRMLARRPPPTDVRLVRLGEPLNADTRYVIHVRGARSLSGNESDARGQVRTPPASETPPPPPARDTTPPPARDTTPVRRP